LLTIRRLGLRLLSLETSEEAFHAEESGSSSPALDKDSKKEEEDEKMKTFRGKVAVITGAASGIGRALAERCIQEGMKVVLADVEEQALQQTSRDLAVQGAETLTVQTDVSQAAAVERLAQIAFETYKAVHLLFNNAGVGAGKTAWESTLADWEWVLGVNLYGTIHGIRSFVPRMLESGAEGYIVNTASMAGLTSSPGLSVYMASKHAVVSLSETLYHELTLRGSNIGVSVLCPGFVKTRIQDAERNRPARLQNAPDAPVSPVQQPSRAEQEGGQLLQQAIREGMSPKPLADMTFAAIREGRFYIYPPEFKGGIHVHMEDILTPRNPTLLLPK
jgi:NAD(P)-dependent dehydrogenase (short-subunit alcohol dehydrogenase family)